MAVNLESLLQSIDKLELAINNAERDIANTKNKKNFSLRFDSYRQICAMQRRFSQDLFYLKEANNTSEVLRKIQLINGLSAMILDDIKNITEQINLKKNFKKNTVDVAVN